MKLTTNEQYTQVALAALESYVLPEVQSTAAKDSVNLIREILKHTLTRSSRGAQVLEGLIEDGSRLYEQICTQFPQECAQFVRKSCKSSQDFESLSKVHGSLIEELDLLCTHLSATRGEDPAVANLLRKAAEWEYAYLDQIRKLDSQSHDGLTNGAPANKRPASQRLTRDSLEAWLKQKHDSTRISAFSSVDGGYSNQTYICTVEHGNDEKQDLVVRKSIATVIAPFFNLHEEFDLLKILHAEGFPAPNPIDLAYKVESFDDTFYTMTRLPGRPPGTLFMGSDDAVPVKLVQQMADVLARLHGIPLDRFAGFYKGRESGDISSETVEACYRRRLRELRAHMARYEHLPSPSITWLFNWLESNIPVNTDLAVMTHGDFDLRNILADEDSNITGVVDWETAELGAPEDDLAYLQAHLPASVDWSVFLDRYYANGGRQVRPDYVRFCQVWGVLRMQVAMNRKVYDLQTGLANDILYFHIQTRFAPGMLQIGLDTVPAHHDTR